MSSNLSLANEISPLAQTFRVLEPEGAVITSIGLYFAAKPAADAPIDIPVTVELRPVTEGGNPSSIYAYPNTRVSKTRGSINANANFSEVEETRFTFPSPLYVPGNSEVAIVVYSNMTANAYKVWVAEMGEFVYGRTDKRITTQPANGSFFKSSNGTAWNADQLSDLAFNVYKADFGTSILTNPPVVALVPDNPPLKAHVSNPIITNNGSNTVYIEHFDHGFQAGEDVRIYGLDSSDTTVGIPHSQIMGTKTIQAVDPNGFTIQTTASATDSDRFGGDTLLTTEQYAFDTMITYIPTLEPTGTSISMKGDFVTHKSWGSSQTAGVSDTNVTLNTENITFFDKPYVIRASDQEGGTPSATIKATLSTDNRYVAPHINWANSSIRLAHNLIDNDLESTYIAGYNTYVSAENPSDTSIQAQHIANPVFLEEGITGNSLKVLLDADRPSIAGFRVWYRTGLQVEGADALVNKTWNEFSRSPALPDYSTYLTVPASRGFGDFQEYEFFKESLTDFDVAQIKITMTTTNSSKPPFFKNLRTIAAI